MSAVPDDTTRLAGLDTWPGFGNYPTTAWQPGEIVVDAYQVRHLGDGLTSYVVWFEGDGRKPIRAGVLTYGEATRTGDLTATAPFTEVRVRITAEANAEVKTPGSLTIVERALTRE